MKPDDPLKGIRVVPDVVVGQILRPWSLIDPQESAAFPNPTPIGLLDSIELVRRPSGEPQVR